MMKRIIYLSVIIVFLLLITTAYIVVSAPITTKTGDLQCKYNNISHKILCTQIGDIVPKWLDLNAGGFLGVNPDYMMELIFQKNNDDYISMHMIDRVFVEGLNRKIIYALNDKSLLDYWKFKTYIREARTNNYGSIVLFCSENNLENDVCKNMKKYHK